MIYETREYKSLEGYIIKPDSSLRDELPEPFKYHATFVYLPDDKRESVWVSIDGATFFKLPLNTVHW